MATSQLSRIFNAGGGDIRAPCLQTGSQCMGKRQMLVIIFHLNLHQSPIMQIEAVMLENPLSRGYTWVPLNVRIFT
jgi:hypothetical protein